MKNDGTRHRESFPSIQICNEGESMKKILLCGERSFVARGLYEKLCNAGFEVTTFSRGDEGRNGNTVHGDVMRMDENPHLTGNFDAVLNFIIIKNEGIEENLRYVEALHRFCEGHHVGRLFHVSSISVYPNGASYVDETSPIETDESKKGSYAAVKVAIDKYLLAAHKKYALTFLRPGYIISDEKDISLAGIVKPLLPRFALLLGNASTSLPLIEKKRLHEAIQRILTCENPRDVYLLLENLRGTKADFARRFYKGFWISLPKRLTIFAAKFLRGIRVFKSRHLEMVKGLFKDTWFDSSETEYDLQMSFARDSVAVIGSGAMGSYTVNRLVETSRHPNITIFDIGNARIQDEASVGISSQIVGGNYTGLQKGRYFGFGGATVKWGGQLLMFTENDFANPSPFLQGIVELNKKYREKVFARFGFHNEFKEEKKRHGLFTKTGIWLGYFNRNLFKHFSVAKKHVFIRANARVVRFIHNGGMISGVEYRTRDGRTKHAWFDNYFLCAGAFESNRIILSSGLAGDHVHFSDHLSQRMYDLKGKPKIDGEDFQFGVKGTSLVTKRLIGEFDGMSFFINPVYNDRFPFFQNLKGVLFRGQRSFKLVLSILRDIPSAIAFAWSMQVLRKIYVYKNEWGMTIDFENRSEDSNVRLSNEKDEWGIPQLVVDFKVGESAQQVLMDAKQRMSAYLKECGVSFTESNDVIHVEKCEDTYHPYGMFMSDARSLEDYFTRFPNLLIINTGVLPRAGGINSTAACFPLIEEYIGNYYDKKENGNPNS